jgi:hypothetical protein
MRAIARGGLAAGGDVGLQHVGAVAELGGRGHSPRPQFEERRVVGHRGEHLRAAFRILQPGQPAQLGFGNAEEDERVPSSASSLNKVGAFVVLDRADPHTPLDQFSPGRIYIRHHEHQSLERARRRSGDPGVQVDRAGRPGWGELDEAHCLADPGVEVDDEADLLGVEALRPVHVRDGNRHHFESPVHGAPSSFRAVVTVGVASRREPARR